MTLLIVVAVAAPMLGVVNDGDVPKTRFPVPVVLVTADLKFVLDGVAKKVATPESNPVMPETGTLEAYSASYTWPAPPLNKDDVGIKLPDPSLSIFKAFDAVPAFCA